MSTPIIDPQLPGKAQKLGKLRARRLLSTIDLADAGALHLAPDELFLIRETSDVAGKILVA